MSGCYPLTRNPTPYTPTCDRPPSLGLLLTLEKVGILDCHQRREFHLPTPRVEDVEVAEGCTQNFLAATGLVSHCCLVVAHEVEQSAHLPAGLTRSPTCLERMQGSTRV